MPNNIDELVIEVKSSADGAARDVARLAAAMERLKNSMAGNTGNNMKRLSQNIRDFKKYVDRIKVDNIDKVARAFKGFKGIDGSGFSKVIKAMEQLPQVMAKYENVNMNRLYAEFKRLEMAIRPLATEVNRLAEAWAKLPKSMRTIGSAARTVTTANKHLEKAEDKAEKSTKRLSLSMSKLKGSLGGISSRMGGVTSALGSMAKYAVAGVGIAGIGTALKNSFTSASNYVEAMNLAQASMGQYYESHYDFWNKAQDLMGVDSAEAMKYDATFQTLITGMGVAGDQAEVMGQQLTQLGYDLASFFNLDTEDAMLKLQSGIAGELEPLRRIGYDLSVARMQQDAMTAGIEGQMSSMTQAEKVQLRYYEIMTQITQSHGDMARTLNSPANQMRILSAQVQILARNFGALLMPALNAIIPPLTAIIKLAQNAVVAIGRMFGADLSSYFADLSTVDTSSISGSAEDAIDDVGSAATGASNKVKELKKQLMGFDEINNLSGDSSDTSSSGGGGGAAGGGGGSSLKDMPTYNFFEGLATSNWSKVYDSMAATFNGISALLEDGKFYQAGHKFAQNIADGMNSIDWDGVRDGINSKLEGVTSFLNGIFGNKNLASSIGSTLAETLNTAVSAAFTLLDTFDYKSFGEWLATAINNAVTTFDWKGLGKSAAKLVDDFFDLVEGAVSTFDLGKVFTSALDAIKSFFMNIDFSKWGAAIGAAAANIVDAIFQGVVWAIDNLPDIASKLFNGVLDILDGVFVGIADYMTKNTQVGQNASANANTTRDETQNLNDKGYTVPVTPVLDTSGATLVGWQGIIDSLGDLWATVKGKFEQSWEDIKTAWDKLKKTDLGARIKADFYQTWENIKDAWDKLKGSASTLGAKISTTFSQAWDDIKKAWNNLTGGRTFTGKISSTFSETWSNITQKWNDLKKAIRLAQASREPSRKAGLTSLRSGTT